MFTFVACQKDISVATVETVTVNPTDNVKTDDAKNVDSTINVNINVPESAGIVYVYNGKEVPASFIDFTNDDLIDASGCIANDSRHYIFDNDAQLDVWANNLLDPTAKGYLTNLIDDVKALKSIATETGALSQFQKTGAAPAAYNIKANDYWQSKYGTRPIPESLGVLYDQCGPQVALFPLVSGTVIPFFPRNARNKVSYIEAIGVSGDVFATRPFLFGRKYYFSPIWNVFGKSLCGHWFNNNNESCLSGF